jgi:ABC-type branched-subunit amino acid transport system substrate-binding protein
VTILTWGPFTGGGMPFPDLAVVAGAFRDTVNADGGVNGRPLSVMVCDDRGRLEGAEGCAREAVARHVSAVVGAAGPVDGPALDVLAAAGIAYLGPVMPAGPELTSPVAFPLTGGIAIQVVGAARAASSGGCVRLAVLGQAGPYSDGLDGFVRRGLTGAGTAFGGVQELPGGLTDLAPSVEHGVAGSDCLLVVAGAQTTQRVLGAVERVGAPIRLFTVGAGYPPRVAAQYPDLAARTVSVDVLPPVDDPVWQRYRDALARAPGGATVAADGQAQRAVWVAFEAFLQVGRGLVGFDAASVLAGLRAERMLDTGGLLPPLDLSANRAGMSGMNRLCNPNVIVEVYSGGRFVRSPQGFVDLSGELR